MAFKKSRKESPEEGREGKKSARTGKNKEWSGGGFTEGNHGIGSTPYLKSHSAAPASLKSHDATSGRGGPGVFGGGDSLKGHAKDLEHPSSHSEFERLGVAEE